MFQIGQDLEEEDPRLKVLRKEWFEDKDCLDIGCNSGIITIQIGNKFSVDLLLLHVSFATVKPLLFAIVLK